MKDLKYIRKRVRKYGTAYLIDIPYNSDTGELRHFTRTVKAIDYGDEKTALIAAQKLRNDALNDINSGKLRRSYPTLKMLYDAKWEILSLTVKTKERHDSIYAQAIAPIERTYIDQLTSADIQLSLNQYAETHSDDQVQRLMTIYRQFYRTAYILGYDVTDQTRAVIRPKSKIVSKKKPADMTIEDFRKILDGLLVYDGFESYDRRCIWFILMIMYYTGVRPAEAMALTADDIHPDYIDINKRVGSTRKEKRTIVPNKTEESDRRIPITPELRQILDQLLQWSKNKYLLACEDGSLWEIDQMSNLVYAVARKEHVKFNAYMLRHKMSTDLLHRGDPVIARDLLGHTSFSMTLDYARSTDEQIRSAMIQRTAEIQPKKKSLDKPAETTRKIYQIYRLCAVMRFLAVFRDVLKS